MTYEDWLATVPPEFTEDTLWKMQVYRKALFLGDMAWHDATRISRMGRWRQLSDQLYRSVGGVSANISEGYSFRSTADELRYFRYALGSARESRDWYYKSRHRLGPKVTEHRLKMVTEVIKQLLHMVSTHPKHVLREESAEYDAWQNTDWQ